MLPVLTGSQLQSSEWIQSSFFWDPYLATSKRWWFSVAQNQWHQMKNCLFVLVMWQYRAWADGWKGQNWYCFTVNRVPMLFLCVSRQSSLAFCLSLPASWPVVVFMPLKYGFSNPLTVCSDICLHVGHAIQSVTLQVQRRKKWSPRHLGFLKHRWVFRYLQRPVLLPKPLDPASTAWGSGDLM